MHDKCCLHFQSAVDEYLIRHRSILDVMTKYQEASARVNRAYAKSVTECGCIQVNASRQQIPPEATFRELRKFMSDHISGEPCEQCREVIGKELGHSLFYLTALCNMAGLQLHDIMHQEHETITTLGVFHLS